MIKKLLKIKVIIILIFLSVLIFNNNCFASNLSTDELYCKNCLVVDIDSGNILFGKNENQRIYPASTTKILTAILAIENLNLEDKVTVSENAYNSIPYNSSVMGVKSGEIYTVEDLLYGLMLPSGNDAAIVLAETISGNMNNFVILMNQKLKELGLEKTHFTNPHGYHDYNHYSTPADMANLFKYCLQNETFRKIISTLEYELKPTNLTPNSRILKSTSGICNPNYPDIYCEYIIGGKTGYTLEANGVFISYGSKDNNNIIICAFNGSQNINGYQARFLDTKKLAEYAFDNYEHKEILKSVDYELKVYDKLNQKYYIIGINDNIDGLFKNNETLIIDYQLNVDFDSLSLLSYSEETSINNSKVGRLNIYDKNKNYINSVDLVYLGNQIYLMPTTTNVIYLIPFSAILLLSILIFVSVKK